MCLTDVLFSYCLSWKVMSVISIDYLRWDKKRVFYQCIHSFFVCYDNEKENVEEKKSRCSNRCMKQTIEKVEYHMLSRESFSSS